MTENTTTTGGTEAEESETEFVAQNSAKEQASLPEELIEIDEDGEDEEDVPGSGAVSGGFGFAGLALAIVSLTTNWTASTITTRASDWASVSSKATTQQQAYQVSLDAAHTGWHTQAWWALAFALGAVLFGAGSLLSPSILLTGRAPGWAKAASTAALIVGVIGAVLAILTLTNVIGAALTAPAAG
jgi:hypothetical protein